MQNINSHLFRTGEEKDSFAEEVDGLRNKTADDLWDVTCCRLNVFNATTWKNHVETQLLEYQNTFIHHVNNGYDPKYNESWSFSGAFLYSLTVITTIGT